MKKVISIFALAGVLLGLAPEALEARRVVVQRQTIVVRTGHPILRASRRTVIVRPPRRAVVVSAPLVFLPAVVWRASVVSLPPRDRMVFADSERITRREDWVDSNFGVDNRGEALYLHIDGRVQLDFAEVTFDNGKIQVVDFNETIHGTGTYPLLDFADGRRVMNVRLVAKSLSKDSRLTVYLRK